MSNASLRANTTLNEQKEQFSELCQLTDSHSNNDLRMLTQIHTQTTDNKMNKKIAIYLRVSTNEQDVDAQFMFVEGLVRTHGFKPEDCAIYQDEGVSATKMKDLGDRPQGKQLIEDMKAGLISHVFAYRIDRMFRDLEGGAVFLKLIKNELPDIAILTTDIALPLTSPDGEFLFGMQVLLARREAAVLAQRTQGGMQVAQEKLRPTSKAVYGWNVCHKANGEPTMRPNWKEQSVLDWIVAQHKLGTSYPKMARQLNAWGIPTKTGSKWVATGCRRHIVSPAKYHQQLHRFTPPTQRTKAPFRVLSVTQK